MASSGPRLSTLITWLLYFVPVYIFIVDPLVRSWAPEGTTRISWLTGTTAGPNADDGDVSEEFTPSTLHLTDDSFISPEDGVPAHCPGEADGYRVHLLSRVPLVLYVEKFVSDQEADHLIKVSLDKYSPSIIYDGVSERVDPSKRLSDRALLDRDDTVRCLEERARAFQGWRPHLYIERMWAQRYNASGHYRHHYDWTGSLARGGDRLSTFMVYLGADCEGGGTHFPRLARPEGQQWCRFLDCEEEVGITFRPLKGNAIFWENLGPDGLGYPETWHAAYPVKSGTKVGLNIWSWYQPPLRKRRGRL
ncbi:hypothetical protein N7539_001583 [Penicillium diatomitis]|uniref:Fe2OG dioxygenase domain-containing protein n=1 Tax=Penicillium diatomitis TaxID=2819901 RepID=A0A9W9XGY4_9EURO|nr:uncharacterized protein N7539_001583 [Penicillium diatomitis]KAJ5492837.1 hypothetical protein N7539_001583 [Penicillium diatomitis]